MPPDVIDRNLRTFEGLQFVPGRIVEVELPIAFGVEFRVPASDVDGEGVAGQEAVVLLVRHTVPRDPEGHVGSGQVSADRGRDRRLDPRNNATESKI